MNSMAHHNTWYGAGQVAALFAVMGASLGNKIQENAGAALAFIAACVMWYLQIRQRIADNKRAEKIAGLETKLREAEIQDKIKRIKAGTADHEPTPESRPVD